MENKVLLLLVVCSLADGAVPDIPSYIADYVFVHVQPLDNTAKDPEGNVPIRLCLTNNGDVSIAKGSWTIYFNIMYGAKIASLDCRLRLGHVNGLLYYLKPLESFVLEPRSEITCMFRMKAHASARSDFMPNWYVNDDAQGAVPNIIRNTVGESLSFVSGFQSNITWKSGKNDVYDPYAPDERFDIHSKSSDTGSASNIALIPTPLCIDVEDNTLVLIKKDWSFVRAEELKNETIVLAQMLSLHEVDEVNTAVDNYIRATLVNESNLNVDVVNKKEAYTLSVRSEPDKIEINASTPTGIFYGIQTLLKLLKPGDNNTWVVPTANIRDAPRFKYRGLMVDVARNFHTKEEIFKVIDVMASLKMNKLHLHLTDDEGWRIEIQKIPELTLVGSRRCHPQTSQDVDCLIPSLGSGPNGDNSGSGFYTVKDYREILLFAKTRHVSVIPEIDVPGHSRAAVVAMEHRRQTRMGQNSSHVSEDQYRLEDSCVSSMQDSCGPEEFEQRWRASTINPCLRSAYSFIETVLLELRNIYAGVDNLEMVHLGGDEVVFAEWEDSAACQKYAKNITKSKLHWNFTQEILKISDKLGLKVGLWEEAMYSVMDSVPSDSKVLQKDRIFVFPWNNVWEWGGGANAARFANAGHQIVLTPATHMYLGHTQESDPEEPGVYWAARFTDTKRVFSFNAHDIYKNIETTVSGQPLNTEQLCSSSSSSCPRLQKHKNVVGLEACLWSETTRTSERLEYMLFPRLLAVAERSWHQAAWETVDSNQDRLALRDNDWARFVSTLGFVELPELERRGIHYRIPPPGARFKDGLLRVNTLYPRHNVEMSSDGVHWFPVSVEISVQSNVLLRSTSPVLKRPSRVIVVHVDNTSSASRISLMVTHLLLGVLGSQIV